MILWQVMTEACYRRLHLHCIINIRQNETLSDKTMLVIVKTPRNNKPRNWLPENPCFLIVCFVLFSPYQFFSPRKTSPFPTLNLDWNSPLMAIEKGEFFSLIHLMTQDSHTCCIICLKDLGSSQPGFEPLLKACEVKA